MSAPKGYAAAAPKSGAGYAYEPHRVTSLPGWDGPLPFNMFAGYLNGSDTSRLFYIYVEADEISPEDAPITAWFNGGPGCSSLDGFWYEHGPFIVDRKGKLSLKPYRWNRLSNMLFLEAPVGVGMSYSLDTSGSPPGVNAYHNDDDKTAAENRNALANFFSLYPALKKHRFFLTGESYAGIYVPTLAEAILDAEDAHQWHGPSLVGIGVGNGCTGTERGICGYYFGSHCDGLYYEWKFLSGFSFISDDIKADVDKYCTWDACTNPASSSASTSGQFPLSQLCINALDRGMKLLGYINIYNVLGDCSFNSCAGPLGNEPVGRVGRRVDVAKLSQVARALQAEGAAANQLLQPQQLQQLQQQQQQGRSLPGLGAAPPLEFDDTVAQITDSGPAECIDSVDASNYMNNPEVQKALHARSPGYCWAVCNHQKGWKYTSTRTDLPRDTYPRLVSRLKVVIYNGDMDACVPYTDNAAWTESMAESKGYDVKKPWHPWSYPSGNLTGDQVAGYAVEYDVSHVGHGSFEFKTVRGAGHMVPTDAPQQALELFRRLIEIPSANISYADSSSASSAPLLASCAPVTDGQGASAVSPQVGLALIMLVFLLVGLVVFLYQEVRALKSRLNGPESPSGHSGGGGRDGDEDGGHNSRLGSNQIDVSERDATVHAVPDEEEEEHTGQDGIELMKGRLNSSLNNSLGPDGTRPTRL